MTNPTTPELAPSPSNALFATTPLPDVQPWTDLAKSPTRPDAFTFALISDRTGFAREGVFERGIAAIDLFNPDFVVQIGDSIEGYTEDIHEIWGQWKQFDEIVAPLEVPLFRTPGNHDVSNEVMSDEWIRRFGALHYAFRYREVLFIVLNTQDPAPKVGETVGGMSSAEFETMLKAMKEKLEQDPSEFIEQVASHQADGAPTGALLSDEQLDWFRATLEANADVRNTIVFMHIPVWEDKSDPQYLAIKEALGERAYTVFGGHLHTYKREVIDGRSWIRLGATGGVWQGFSHDPGVWDHISLVSVDGEKVRVGNLLLEGIFDEDGGIYRSPRSTTEPVRFSPDALPIPEP